MAAGAWGGWGCCRGTASSAPHICNVGWGWGRKTGKILVSLAVFAHSLERRGRRTRWGENMSALEPWWISQQTLHLWPGGKQTPVGRCQPWPRSLLQSFCPRWCFGMQQCLGAGSGAASFPSPPAQVVLNGDTSACPSPRTPLRATCDHCPGHIPPLHALQLPPQNCSIFRAGSEPLGSPKPNPSHLPGQWVILPLFTHSSCHTSAE